MLSKKAITHKVFNRLNKTGSEAEFKTRGIKVYGFEDILQDKILDNLKKEWGLSDIDLKELDWDIETVTLDWKLQLPRSSGVLNIRFSIPDQKVNVSGEALYTDKSGKDYESNFLEIINIDNVDVEADRVKISDDIAPQEIEYYKGKFTVKF